jgi:hypothetical protein
MVPGAGCHFPAQTNHLADEVGQILPARSHDFSPSLPHLGPAAVKLLAAINSAVCEAQLVESNRLIWVGVGSNEISEQEGDILARCVYQRRPSRGYGASIAFLTTKVRTAMQSRYVSRQRPRSPDRKASRDRRRTWARGALMPAALRSAYTEGQAAALAVIAKEAQAEGDCRLPLDKVAALAGVCRTIVQSALHEARRLGHVTITERPQRGRKSLTNIVAIISPEWRAWLRLGAPRQGGIGSKFSKTANPTMKSSLEAPKKIRSFDFDRYPDVPECQSDPHNDSRQAPSSISGRVVR